MSTLFYYGFQGCWEAMHDGIFKEKYCEKVDFLQIRHFFKAEMGKAFSEN